MTKPDLDKSLDEMRSERAEGGRGGRRNGAYGAARKDRTRQGYEPYSRSERRRPAGRGSDGRVVKLSNLNPTLIEDDIESIFDGLRVERVKVDYDSSGRSNGSAEVTFESAKDAADAVTDYDRAEVDGEIMYVALVKDEASFGRERREDRGDRRVRSGRGPSRGDECFKCGGSGHWARECPDQERGGGRGRDRGERRGRGGGGGRRGGGRGGGGREGKESKTAEQLDAEMDDYFSAKKKKEDAEPAAAAE